MPLRQTQRLYVARLLPVLAVNFGTDALRISRTAATRVHIRSRLA